MLQLINPSPLSLHIIQAFEMPTTMKIGLDRFWKTASPIPWNNEYMQGISLEKVWERAVLTKKQITPDEK